MPLLLQLPFTFNVAELLESRVPDAPILTLPVTLITGKPVPEQIFRVPPVTDKSPVIFIVNPLFPVNRT